MQLVAPAAVPKLPAAQSVHGDEPSLLFEMEPATHVKGAEDLSSQMVVSSGGVQFVGSRRDSA